jgi:hypothetical protein
MLIRPIIDGPTPIFFFTKPQPRTGASLLINALLLIATGAEGENQSEVRDDDNEIRKSITSRLMSGASYLWVDNINHRIESGVYANMVTAATWTDRKLGTNTTVNIPMRMTTIFSGNNIGATGEIMHRCCPIRLETEGDPRDRRPADFRHQNLPKWVREHRGELLAAYLTCVNYWRTAGEARRWDQGDVQGLAGFEEWQSIVGGILDAIKLPGFLTNAAELHASANEEDSTWRTIVQEWFDLDGLNAKKKLDEIGGDDGIIALNEGVGGVLPIRGFDDAAKQRSAANLIRSQLRRVFKIMHGPEGSRQQIIVRLCGEHDTSSNQKKYHLEAVDTAEAERRRAERKAEADRMRLKQAAAFESERVASRAAEEPTSLADWRAAHRVKHAARKPGDRPTAPRRRNF